MKTLTTLLLTLLVLGGCTSKGYIFKGDPNGYGNSFYSNGQYIGPHKDGLPQGWGIFVYSTGDKLRAKFNKGYAGTRFPFDNSYDNDGFGAATCTRKDGKVYLSNNVTDESLRWIKEREKKINELGPIDLSEIKVSNSGSPNFFVINGITQECNSRAEQDKNFIQNIKLEDVVLGTFYVALGTVYLASEIANSSAGQAYIDNKEAENQRKREAAAYKKGKEDELRKRKKARCSKNPSWPEC